MKLSKLVGMIGFTIIIHRGRVKLLCGLGPGALFVAFDGEQGLNFYWGMGAQPREPLDI